MANLKDDNKAEYNLTVGSLKVIGDVTGGGIDVIKRSIEVLQNSVTTVSEKNNKYWRDIADDSLITPEEKQSLRREYNNLDQTYTAIIAAATEKGYLTKDAIKELKKAYDDLTEYLFDTLKLFNDMGSNTQIPDPEVFNNYFAVYYDKEFKAQSYLSQGSGGGYQSFEFAAGTKTTYPAESSTDWKDAPPEIPEGMYLWLRTCFVTADGTKGTWSYARIQGEQGPEGDEGPEGPTGPAVKALYSKDGQSSWHDTFDTYGDRYMKLSYDDGETYTDPIKIVGEDGQGSYSGIVYNAAGLPDPEDGNFFLSGGDFKFQRYLSVSASRLKLSNEAYLTVSDWIDKGFIYYCNRSHWTKVTDRDNWRYIIALNDLVTIGAELSPSLEELLEDRAAKVVEEKVQSNKYLGEIDDIDLEPTNPKDGDFYTWIGDYIPDTGSYTERKTSYIYRWLKNGLTGEYHWTELVQTDTDNYQYYMTAFPSVMNAKRQDLTTDYFATVFANALIGNTAFLKKLCSQIIQLQEGDDGSLGLLKSSNYYDDPITTAIEYKDINGSWHTEINETVYGIRASNTSGSWEIEGSIFSDQFSTSTVQYGISDSSDKDTVESWKDIPNTGIDVKDSYGKYLHLKQHIEGTLIPESTTYSKIQLKKTYSEGFQIDTEGNANFRSNTNIGGNCTIDGKTLIKGEAVIADTVTVKAFINAKNITFDKIKPGNNPLLASYSATESTYGESTEVKILYDGTYLIVGHYVANSGLDTSNNKILINGSAIKIYPTSGQGYEKFTLELKEGDVISTTHSTSRRSDIVVAAIYSDMPSGTLLYQNAVTQITYSGGASKNEMEYQLAQCTEWLKNNS